MNEGWRCNWPDIESASIGVLSSPSLASLAERVAHRFRGILIQRQPALLHVERLIVLSDGQNSEGLCRQVDQIQASSILVIGVGLPNPLLARPFTDAAFTHVPDDSPAILWKAIETAVEGKRLEALVGKPPKVFLSHAVADEGRLFPAIDDLRRTFGLDIFVCADSVPAGGVWREHIDTQLRSSDVFVFAASAASVASLYCAYEVGLATALDKVIRVIRLDNASMPAYMSERQAIDLSRLRQRKPWLDDAASILDALIEALTPIRPH